MPPALEDVEGRRFAVFPARLGLRDGAERLWPDVRFAVFVRPALFVRRRAVLARRARLTPAAPFARPAPLLLARRAVLARREILARPAPLARRALAPLARFRTAFGGVFFFLRLFTLFFLAMASID